MSDAAGDEWKAARHYDHAAFDFERERFARASGGVRNHAAFGSKGS